MNKLIIKNFASRDDRKIFNSRNLLNNVKNATVLLYLISAFEIIMIVRMFLTQSHPFPHYIIRYIFCYSFLLTVSILTFIGIKFAQYSKKERLLFLNIITTAYEILILLWSIAITILDSYKAPQLIVYVTIVVCITSILKLRPWLFLGIEIGGFALLSYGLYRFTPSFNTSFIINLAVFTSIFVIISITKYNNSVTDFYNNNRIEQLNNLLEQEKTLYEKATITDQLTGLFNRNILKADISSRIENNYKTGCATGIAMFDLDNFKAINDTYGHSVGDECLRKLGRCFKNYPIFTVYRYGGEEFLAVCDGVSEIQFISTVQQIIEDVSQFKFPDNNLKVTISAGCTYQIPQNDNCDEKLIRIADSALYKAKAAGKNRYYSAK